MDYSKRVADYRLSATVTLRRDVSLIFCLLFLVKLTKLQPSKARPENLAAIADNLATAERPTSQQPPQAHFSAVKSPTTPWSPCGPCISGRRQYRLSKGFGVQGSLSFILIGGISDIGWVKNLTAPPLGTSHTTGQSNEQAKTRCFPPLHRCVVLLLAPLPCTSKPHLACYPTRQSCTNPGPKPPNPSSCPRVVSVCK